MTKVILIHPFELRPEVNAEEFEEFFLTEMAAYTRALPGWKQHLLKCFRGEREGKYTALLEVESREAYERYFPPSGSPAPEDAQVVETYAATYERLRSFVVDLPNPRTSDYIILGE